MRGVHAPAAIEGAAIVSDCTQGSPAQRRSAGIALSAVQAPSHASGAANDVATASGSPPGHEDDDAAHAVGIAHETSGGSHAQIAHVIGTCS
ncbi:hypothetical protein [Sorangium sp. So ce1335]|uniref:hypothetical protein n=1 Tax=Sorangium sp. So ce1335 TaxID=3133335 RepID=UPI003F648946